MSNKEINNITIAFPDRDKDNAVHLEGIEKIVQTDPPKDMKHPLVSLMNEYGGCNGMAHSTNPAHKCELIFNNFPHRSYQEVIMHKALYKMNQRIAKEKGAEYSFLYWPLPVAECLNQQRVELDYLVAINGHIFGIEVDGDSHIDKFHFDEEERLKFLKLNGIEVYRVKPNEKNSNWAEDWLNSIFKIIERKKGLI